MKIFKYDLQALTGQPTEVRMHSFLPVLSAVSQRRGWVSIYAYAYEEKEAPSLDILRRFFVIGTGDRIPEGVDYVATVLDNFGSVLIWHIFEMR